MVLRSCANLLVSALSSERFQEIISLIVSTAMTERKNHSSRVSCDDLYQLVAEVFDELERLLVQQGDDGYTSMFGFVDDMLSLIYSDTTYNMLRSTASKILLHKQDSIKVMIQDFYQVFESYAHEYSEISRVDDVDAQPRAESWMETSRPTNWYDIAGQTCRLGPNSLMNTTRTWSENWCRRWFLDPTSLSIHPSYSPVNAADARLHDSNPSLLSVLAFIAILASVDLTIEGSRLSVEAVMSESTPDLHTTSGTVLELDGQTRTFEKLPSGLPAAAASVLFGDSWNFDAYSGYVSDDGGSLEILLTTPSQSQANQRFERPNKYYAGTELTLLARTVRVHLSLNDESDSHRGCCLVIHAEFFQAQLEKNATTGRLAHNSSVLNWSKVHEINATYVALPLNSSPI
ncbi:hypothetical protein PC114_g7435 [Phytophthora cactorum]|nr:hypothetical protein PC114_g7435 [Phytophthora cactorum]KAG4051517.1 hypothetical protein PC123_g13272 [Phytophthora cactorum]